MVVKGYHELAVWRKAIGLTKEIYQVTDHLPPNDEFGLMSQLRRAAVSVPSNIAEGQARRNPREFRQFIYHALGSLAEVDTQVVLAVELGFFDVVEVRPVAEHISEIRRMLHGLEGSLPAYRDRGKATGHGN